MYETHSSSSSIPSNVDRDLFNDLVEIVPLVQSLLTDRKASTSFTRRGSVTYTKTPSRDSLSKKQNDSRARNENKSTLAKRRAGNDEGNNSKNDTGESADKLSVFSSANMAAQKEELNALREQVENLQRKLLEKDELLKTAEASRTQMTSIQTQINELRRYASDKDSLVRSTQLQLSDAKIKLADKQAALEKLQWEASTSNQKVDNLREELSSMQTQLSSFMLLFEGLSKDEAIIPTEDYDVTPHYMDHLPQLDDMDETEMQKMEEAREVYMAAIEVAKAKQDEESLADAVNARLHLQSFVFRTSTDISKTNCVVTR